MDPNKNLQWPVVVFSVVMALAACIAGPVLLSGDDADHLSMLGCAIAGWLGLHTQSTWLARLRPQFSSMAAIFSMGTTIELVRVAHRLHFASEKAALWCTVAIFGFLSGTPLSTGFAAVIAPMAPPSNDQEKP